MSDEDRYASHRLAASNFFNGCGMHPWPPFQVSVSNYPSGDGIQIYDEPSPTLGGVWVVGWIWVPDEEAVKAKLTDV